MVKARTIMTKKVVSVFPETEITEAVKLMFKHHYNGLPVVDTAGRLLGIICQDDLIIQQKKVPLPSFFTLLDGFIPLTSYKKIEKEVEKMVATTVAEAMTSNPITVDPETSLEEIASLMLKHNVHTLPVVDNDTLVGIIGKEDILRTLISTEDMD
ncbi:MAG TPA: CBS domain-containing protein [Syntrophales bacterium]|nr:CBS domain-containing protein [Syntrophales bacterium]